MPTPGQSVFPSTAVEDWVDARRKGSGRTQRRIFGAVAAVVDRLELCHGQPDGNVLFDEGSGLCSAKCWVGDEAWVIAYYVAPDGRVLLLKPCLGRDPAALAQCIETAREMQRRCIAYGHDIDQV